jgi:predicted AlkP superfamily phosphohydrolase/phosphomutase
MPARVLFIGADAAEATLIERWAAEGHLPAFARLGAAAAPARLENPLETLPGAIWPEITTGRSGRRDAIFYPTRQIKTGEGRFRPVRAAEHDPRTFYREAAAAGRRVAVVDLPHTALERSLGAHVVEYDLHDHWYGTTSQPPGLLAELRARHGDPVITACDDHDGSEAGYLRLVDGLIEGARRKTELLLDLLAREPWDLFAGNYSEGHCAGHQLWHFVDARAPRHPRAAPEKLRHGLRAVYAAIDEGIGRLMAAAGPGADVLVLASHGMTLYTGGPQLLPKVLRRLGMGGTRRSAWRAALPGPLVRLLRLVPRNLRRRAHAAADAMPHPLELPSTRAVDVDNLRCGAIRLNLSGREPRGRVAPGREEAALIAELRDELLRLEDPASGQRIVEQVLTAREAFGDAHSPDVPDLIVRFRSDLGPLEACRSPRIGLVRSPLYKPHLPRTGDHSVESRLWAVGPDLPARLEPGDVLDVAPTLLALLGVTPPAWMDGRPRWVERPAVRVGADG